VLTNAAKLSKCFQLEMAQKIENQRLRIVLFKPNLRLKMLFECHASGIMQNLMVTYTDKHWDYLWNNKKYLILMKHTYTCLLVVVVVGFSPGFNVQEVPTSAARNCCRRSW
jgi:hypothetical protein